MPTIPNADGSTPTAKGWFDNLFTGVKQLGTLSGTVAAWKELVDPVRAVQQPTLGTGSSGPVPIVAQPVTPKPVAAAPANPIVWYLVGGLGFLLIVVLIGRRG